MDPEALRRMLQQLHGELEEGQPVDDRTRDLLRKVLSDINDVLDTAAASEAGAEAASNSASEAEPGVSGGDVPPVPGEHHSLIERLKASTWHLEESHPRLTATVSDLVDGLTAIFR